MIKYNSLLSKLSPELSDLLQKSIDIVIEVGKLQLDWRENPSLLGPEIKPDRSLFSAADTSSERMIKSQLKEFFPEIDFLGEEDGAVQSGAKRRWILDPIDGSGNFLAGSNDFAILLGLQDLTYDSGMLDSLVLHVTYMPATKELFIAIKDSGAYKINIDQMIAEKLDATKPQFGGLYAAITGNTKTTDSACNVAAQKAILMNNGFSDRNPGACGIILARMAEGAIHFYSENNGISGPWDMTGALLLKEAGGYITSAKGDASFLDSRTIAAGCSKEIHQTGLGHILSTQVYDMALSMKCTQLDLPRIRWRAPNNRPA